MQDHDARIMFGVRILSFEPAKISDRVIPIDWRVKVVGDVDDPRLHVLSVTPASAPVQPGAMLVRFHAPRNVIRTAQRGTWKRESQSFFIHLAHHLSDFN